MAERKLKVEYTVKPVDLKFLAQVFAKQFLNDMVKQRDFQGNEDRSNT